MRLLLALAAGMFATAAYAQAPDPMPRIKPEDAGFSPARLARIATVLNEDIQKDRIPGAVLAIARNGKLVYFQAFGYRDKAAGTKMTTDTIFNIASMTKPMTAVAALSLVEQGKLVIDEPISRTLPGFTDMKVAVLNEDGSAIANTVPANRAITMRDLPDGGGRHETKPGRLSVGRGVPAAGHDGYRFPGSRRQSGTLCTRFAD